MLDPWIIEQIRRREQEERERQEPRVDMPLPPPYWDPPSKEEAEPGSERGVVIISI